ncbi:MAG: hypothetical protein KF889_24150 [Alphaproteobacteria bacterium]|nr:hypothetical protein [Alphaproteobacteria bacterium]MCW5742551.1 hypothetical protein [Alphaproteobacteria bacterium]
MDAVTRRAALAGALAASIAGIRPATARQLAFQQRPSGAAVDFSFAWRDLERRERRIAFRLPAAEVEAAMQSFRDFSIPDLYRHVEAAAIEAGQREGVTVTTQRVGEAVDFAMQGDPQRVRRLNQRFPAILDNARGLYLVKHYRRAEGDAIYVDHAAAARHFGPILRPVAEALRALGGDERALVGHALHLVQTIPYDDFRDPRSSGGGLDFAAPPAMFKINKGECDSKSVALGAILRTLAPSLQQVFVTLPGHVFLAASLPAQRGDDIVPHGGRAYVALEATGPDLAPVGVAGQRSAGFIAQRSGYRVFPVPP